MLPVFGKPPMFSCVSSGMCTNCEEPGRDCMSIRAPPAIPLGLLGCVVLPVAIFRYGVPGPSCSPLIPTAEGSDLQRMSMLFGGDCPGPPSMACRECLWFSFLIFHCISSCFDRLESKVWMVALRKEASSMAGVCTLGKVLKVTMLSLCGGLQVMTSTFLLGLFKLLRDPAWWCWVLRRSIPSEQEDERRSLPLQLFAVRWWPCWQRSAIVRWESQMWSWLICFSLLGWKFPTANKP